MKKIIITLIAAFLLAALTGCLGTGDVPERSIGMDDAVIGRMAREIGMDEISVLLNSPDDIENPGLPMSHLLTMIDRISLDKLIGIIQQTGARKTVDLIYAVKRLGCNRPVDGHPEGKFNIPVADTYSDCSLSDYNYLDVMVSLMNGTENVDQLAMLINQNPFDDEEPAIQPEDVELEGRRYLEKLAYLVVYLENPEKMVALINGVKDPRDVVYFINQFDNDLELPVSTAQIINGTKLKGIQTVLAVMKGVTDHTKMYQLINGKRTALTPEDDGLQKIYLGDKLKPIMDGGSSTIDEWTEKITLLVNNVTQMQRLSSLIAEMDGTAIASMVTLLEQCTAPASGNSIPTLALVVDGVPQASSLIDLMREINPADMAVLINEVSSGSTVDDNGIIDPLAAGTKLAAIIGETDDIYNVIFYMQNVNSIQDMTGLINYLKVANAPRISGLMNTITGTNSWDPAAPSSADGIGKLVNLVSNISSLTETADLIEGITDETKLPALINGIQNSSFLVNLVNTVIESEGTQTSDLTGFINALSNDDMPKTARIITDLNSERDALLAGLLAPYSDATGGIGCDEVAGLISGLSTVDDAAKMASFMKQVNDSLPYGGSAITMREGIVRFVRAGGYLAEFPEVKFPGLGSGHVATMISLVDTPSTLADMVNTTDIISLVVLNGCVEQIPDFYTPCTACNMGW